MPEPTAGGRRSAARPSALIDLVWARFGHLVRELGKFGTVGLLSYLVDLTIFNLLLGSVGWSLAKTISTVIAATLAFLGNRLWTWREREHSTLVRAYGLYFLFNAIGLGISLGCLWLSHDFLGSQWPDVFRTRLADNISAMVIGMTLGTAFRFWSYRTFVFVTREAPKVGTSVTASDRKL